MTNAERLLLLKRARLEIQKVRDGIELVSMSCPHCDEEFVLDEGAFALSRELCTLTAALSSWIERLSKRPFSSERVSPETQPGVAPVSINGTAS